MLPRSKRLSVPLFTRVIAEGKLVHSPLFTARILKTADPSAGGARFSAVISKKVEKTAVLRNTLRRRIYSAIGNNSERIKDGFLIILIAKPPLTSAKVTAIRADLEELFVKNGLVK